jgi:integrase
MQRCRLIRKNRKRGPDVWLLRWSDKSGSGRRIIRKRVIGTIDEFVDTDAARRAVASLAEKIKGDNPRISLRAITISVLCNHFERCELAQGNTWRSYSTKKRYAGYLKRWGIPKWGKYELENIKTIEVESCLRLYHLQRQLCENPRRDVRSIQ